MSTITGYMLHASYLISPQLNSEEKNKMDNDIMQRSMNKYLFKKTATIEGLLLWEQNSTENYNMHGAMNENL